MSQRGSRGGSRGIGRGGPPARPTRREGRVPHGPKPARGGGSALVQEVRSLARPPFRDQAGEAFEQAVDLLERGRARQAADAAQVAKRLAPRSGAVREVLGIALYRSERFREALRELQTYRRITGRLDQNHLIGDAYRALGAPEKGVEAAREAMRARIPDEARVEAAVVGASALADMGRFGEALSVLRSFPSRADVARPFELRLWYVAGDILERAGRRSEAREEFRRIVRHDPQAFDAAERLAKLE